MALIGGIVGSANGLLNSAASGTFGAIVNAGGTLIAAMATLAVVMLGINIVLQYRPVSAGTAVVLGIKLIIIGTIGLNWAQFSYIANTISGGMDAIAAVIIADYTGTALTAGQNVSGTLAGSMDDFLADFAQSANKALEPLGWAAAAFMSTLITIMLGLIAALAGLALIFAKVMLTVYLGLAPIFIALSMYEATKDYFSRWLQAAVSYMIYPVVIATVLGGVLRLVSNYINSLQANGGTTIMEFIPFLAALFIMLVAIVFIPFIVNSLSGMIMAPGPGDAARTAGNAARTTKDAATKAAGTMKQVGSIAAGGAQSLASRIAARSSRF